MFNKKSNTVLALVLSALTLSACGTKNAASEGKAITNYKACTITSSYSNKLLPSNMVQSLPLDGINLNDLESRLSFMQSGRASPKAGQEQTWVVPDSIGTSYEKITYNAKTCGSTIALVYPEQAREVTTKIDEATGDVVTIFAMSAADGRINLIVGGGTNTWVLHLKRQAYQGRAQVTSDSFGGVLQADGSYLYDNATITWVTSGPVATSTTMRLQVTGFPEMIIASGKTMYGAPVETQLNVAGVHYFSDLSGVSGLKITVVKANGTNWIKSITK